MKGLLKLPSQDDLIHSYSLLQSGKNVSEDDYALFSQWARFDARLAEIWIRHFSENWRQIDAILFRKALLKTPWPQTCGVLIRQVLTYCILPPAEKHALRFVFKMIMDGVRPVPYQDFFIGLTPFASASARAASEQPLKSYSDWGFYGQDMLINKAYAKNPTSSRSAVSKKIRLRILDELVCTRERLTVQDYREKLQNAVSLRVAQLDLEAHASLKAVGNTRARFYVKKRP